MVTEDRQRDGLLLTQSVRVNTTLSALADQFAAAGVIRSELEQQRTTQQCESMETRCTDMEQMVRTLSGGNQQKVAIAKWLVRDADVFLFDEPTRGIDVAARKRIYDLFATLASAGKGLIIASSDLQELLANCDRIAVMSAGHLEAIFDRDTWSEDAIMRAAFSRYLQPQVA
jgi:ribose transport system ATP-binding protein